MKLSIWIFSLLNSIIKIFHNSLFVIKIEACFYNFIIKLFKNLLLLKINAFSKDFTDIKQFLLQQENIKFAKSSNFCDRNFYKSSSIFYWIVLKLIIYFSI